MRKPILFLVIALALSGCLGSGLDTGPKQAVAFCKSYVGTMQKMVTFRQADMLTESQIETVTVARHAIGPYCAAPQITEPTAALISALDTILLMMIGGTS